MLDNELVSNLNLLVFTWTSLLKVDKEKAVMLKCVQTLRW